MIVSDTGAGCLDIFSSELQKLFSVELHGKDPNHLSGPDGIAMTDGDLILLADCNNHPIYVLTMEGQFLASVGTAAKEPLRLKPPNLHYCSSHCTHVSIRKKQQLYSSFPLLPHIFSLIFHTRFATRSRKRPLPYGSG